MSTPRIRGVNPIARARVAVIPLLFLLFATPAAALETSLALGASVTASRDTTAAAWLDIAGERRSSGSLHWRPTVSLGVIGARDVRADLDRHVLVLGAGVRLVDWWKQAFFGIGVAHASRTTAALSSHGQFVSTLGWRGERHVLMLRHVSNADLFGGKNLGETMLLFGFAF